MKGQMVWLRMWVMGAAWGSACGVAVGLVLVWAMVGSVWAESSGVGEFMATQTMWTLVAFVYGGVIGCVLGFGTGLVAGLALEASLRLLGVQQAVVMTIVAALSAQVAVVMAMGDLSPGVTLWGPAITIVPLALVTQNCARNWTEFRSMSRDTFAA